MLRSTIHIALSATIAVVPALAQKSVEDMTVEELTAYRDAQLESAIVRSRAAYLDCLTTKAAALATKSKEPAETIVRAASADCKGEAFAFSLVASPAGEQSVKDDAVAAVLKARSR